VKGKRAGEEKKKDIKSYENFRTGAVRGREGERKRRIKKNGDNETAEGRQLQTANRTQSKHRIELRRTRCTRGRRVCKRRELTPSDDW